MKPDLKLDITEIDMENIGELLKEMGEKFPDEEDAPEDKQAARGAQKSA